VSPQLTVKLSQILDAYITWDELSDMSSIFEVEIQADRRWLSVARFLIENLNQPRAPPLDTSALVRIDPGVLVVSDPAVVPATK
jgi:hypothetical protein